VKLLLDTRALVWWVMGDRKLPRPTRSLIDDADNTVYVSAVTAIELSTKHRLGKFAEARALIDRYFDILRESSFTSLSITAEHGFRAGRLKGAHRDPFDRILVAQAIVDGLRIVSIDAKLAALGAKVLWQTR
jgi:PIN domain nuclease of toxin-antitoxin system